ncbi:MAG: hypothetical protein RR397_11545 [Odoribacter sp.]
MKEYSVCYDRFCIGKFTVSCEDCDGVVPFDDLGAFEMYLLGMWSDGMVVTMKGYDEKAGESRFVLLIPDGSEQLMSYSKERGFVVEAYRNAGEGRFAYLLAFLQGLKYRGYEGYEEYEEGMICGVVNVGEKSLTYCGRNFAEVQEDFVRVIEEVLDV